MSIQALYTHLIEYKSRNHLIIQDILKAYSERRNILVLTQRTAHVKILFNELQKNIPDIFSLIGSQTKKHNRETLKIIEDQIQSFL